MRKLSIARFRKLREKFPLAPEEKTIILRAGNAIWSEIAYDCLEGSSRTIPASQVIELVIDASRLEEHLKRHKHLAQFPRIAALFPEKFDIDASDYVWEIMREQFPTGRYGL